MNKHLFSFLERLLPQLDAIERLIGYIGKGLRALGAWPWWFWSPSW
jgi:hypothetical protein